MSREFKKLNAETVKLSKMKVGTELEGIFKSRGTKQITDKETGELKAVPNFIMEKEGGERFTFLADAGFISTFEDCGIEEGNYIKVVKGEQADIGNGRRVNTYDIFKAQ